MREDCRVGGALVVFRETMHKITLVLLPAALGALTLAACGDDDTEPRAAPDAGAEDAGEGGPSDGSVPADEDGGPDGSGDAGDAGPDAPEEDGSAPGGPWPKLLEGAIGFPRIAVDAAGNVFVAGRLRGSAHLGGDELVSAGGTDAVVASFAPDGSHRWSHVFGSTEPDDALDLAIDADSNVYVTGAFRGTVQLSDDRELVSSGEDDAFVVSYTADGQMRFAQSYGTASTTAGYSVALDPMGLPVIAGQFSGEITLGDDVYDSELQMAGFVAWLDEDGVPRQSVALIGAMTAEALAIDEQGTTIAGVSFNGPFDPGNGELSPVGRVNSAVLSYDATGALQWVVPLLGTERIFIQRTALAANGDILVVGSAEGSFTFAGETLPAPETRSAFLLRLAADGTPIWARQVGSSHVYGFGLALLGDSVVIAGSYRETVTFADMPFEPLTGPPGGYGGYLAAFDADGTPQWARSYAPGQDLSLTGIAALPDNDGLFVAGDLYGELIIDGRTLGPIEDYGGGLLLFTVAPSP